jgi:hypothetical protein
LVGVWVDELRTSWKKKPRSQNATSCVIDLNDVTFIDQRGERLLRAMSKKGAELVAKGIYTKYLLEKVKTIGKRSLPALFVCLFGGFVATVIPFSSGARMNADVGELNTQQEVGARRHFQLNGEDSMNADAQTGTIHERFLRLGRHVEGRYKSKE